MATTRHPQIYRLRIQAGGFHRLRHDRLVGKRKIHHQSGVHQPLATEPVIGFCKIPDVPIQFSANYYTSVVPGKVTPITLWQ